MTIMRKLSVAEAKARLSEVVAAARRGRRVLILRHGKPAASVVPVSALDAEARRPISEVEARAFFESFDDGDPTVDAVSDLLSSRR
jgi:prevent-host-death family protein